MTVHVSLYKPPVSSVSAKKPQKATKPIHDAMCLVQCILTVRHLEVQHVINEFVQHHKRTLQYIYTIMQTSSVYTFYIVFTWSKNWHNDKPFCPQSKAKHNDGTGCSLYAHNFNNTFYMRTMYPKHL